MDKEYFRIVCVDEGDPLEYKVLEDSNQGSLSEVHKFVDENFHKHNRNGVKWLLLPAIVSIQ